MAPPNNSLTSEAIAIPEYLTATYDWAYVTSNDSGWSI